MLIHRTANIECFFEDRGGDFLLITFNEMGMRADGQRFWADNLARKLGFSAAGFVSSEPNWFPRADMSEAVAALGQAVHGQFRSRVAYGHSQGGYAALKYSGALGATASIAFCPQCSIDPADIEDARFNRYFRPSIHADMRIRAEEVVGRAFVFYDPHEPKDQAHARLISAVVPMTEVLMPFSGHGTVRLFSNTGLAADLLAACQADYDPMRFARLRAAARRRNLERPYYMTLALAQRRPALAAAIFEEHRMKLPWARWAVACYRLAKAGRAEQAARWAEEAAAAEPRNPESHACLALIKLDLGRAREALQHIERSLEISPDNAKYVFARKRALDALGQVVPA